MNKNIRRSNSVKSWGILSHDTYKILDGHNPFRKERSKMRGNNSIFWTSRNEREKIDFWRIHKGSWRVTISATGKGHRLYMSRGLYRVEERRSSYRLPTDDGYRFGNSRDTGHSKSLRKLLHCLMYLWVCLFSVLRNNECRVSFLPTGHPGTLSNVQPRPIVVRPRLPPSNTVRPFHPLRINLSKGHRSD